VTIQESQVSKRERILGGLWGSVVGDALGVPVEFKNRADVQLDPVKDMRGFGTHGQPPGTWSDDSSLLLCSVDSLLRHEFDLEDLGQRFVKWFNEELWNPHGHLFDIGNTTTEAIVHLSRGVRAEVAGSDSQFSNGNGSLMRIIPVSLRFANLPLPQALDRVHRASSVTHRHIRSQLSCGFYTIMIRELLSGADAATAYTKTVATFREFYEQDPSWSVELDYFHLLLGEDVSRLSESEIASSGYVVHTLTASVWCLLTTSTYSDCVLKAVNLGGDTDTTGCVAGGLAGVLYGVNSIPQNWINALARRDDLDSIFDKFADLCKSIGSK
jgi:ADP-ribosyl-[dinitrogen reductase] hydrolase